MVSIGSKRPDAKEININFQKKHLVFGLILFVLVIIYYSLIVNDSPFLEKHIICPDGSKQMLLYNNTQICGIDLPYSMKAKEQVKYYNKFYTLENYVNINGTNVIIKKDLYGNIIENGK